MVPAASGVPIASAQPAARLFDSITEVGEHAELRPIGATAVAVAGRGCEQVEDGGVEGAIVDGFVDDAYHPLGGHRTCLRHCPVPRVLPRPGRMRGLALASHLLDVLVQERLVRELRAAERMNAARAAIDAHTADEVLRIELQDALGCIGRLPV
jgi:hypothetical protein